MSSRMLSRFSAGRVLRTARLALVALVLGTLLATLLAAPAGAAEPVAKVNPHGTYAAFQFVSASPAFFMLQVSATPPVGNAFANPLVNKVSPNNVTYWAPRAEGLAPGTTYYYLAVRQVGADLKIESGSFKTLRRQVTVHYYVVSVADDSDSWGAGELRFHFKANGALQYNLAYGQVSVASGGKAYPDRKAVLANAPGTLKLAVQGIDDDCDVSEPLCADGSLYTYPTDGGSNDIADWATANSGVIQLKSGVGESYSAPFTLTTNAYALKFSVSGTYTVAYVP